MVLCRLFPKQLLLLIFSSDHLQKMASSPDHLPFETASVIRLIRDFLQHNEAAGMHLWDLSADESAAGGGWGPHI